MPNHAKFLIIGAGPTGLGAANALKHAGEDCIVLEGTKAAGGLASSFIDEMGFTWDIGGHVQFSHHAEYHTLMDSLFPPEGWLMHERSAWAWLEGSFVAYPVQQHLHQLPEKIAKKCLSDLPQSQPTSSAPHFAAWLEARFGRALTEAFMRPYNEKIWATPLEEMSYQWIEERIAPAASTQTQPWGPNTHFRFPARGGTGSIWQALAGKQPDIRFDHHVVSINPASKQLECSNGQKFTYQHLISTLPLPTLCKMLQSKALTEHAQKLRHSSTHIVGLGMRGSCPNHLQQKSWLYFSEPNTPFYRASVFSNYSPHHTPQGEYWSLMTETSESAHKKVDAASLIQHTVEGCLNTGLIEKADSIVSRWHYHAPYGYPTPTLDRDEALRAIQPALEEMDIYSRGRFGGWKYEVGNQDHSYLQGTQIIQRLLGGVPESIYKP